MAFKLTLIGIFAMVFSENKRNMKHLFILLSFICIASPSMASEVKDAESGCVVSEIASSGFVGRIENGEYQVYIVMDFYRKNITCPRQEIFGQNPGYFGAVRDTRKWIIEDSNIKGNTAYLVIINDYGSEDLEAKLTFNPHDGTYTLERTEGSTIKIVVNRQWVKIPKKLVFKRRTK